MTNYLDILANEIGAELSADQMPETNPQALLRIYAVLALAKGVETSPKDVHNAWSAWMASEDADHESLIPFEQLPADVRQEDSPYVLAIRKVAVRHS